MFRYIEQIILNENVILLKKIILDMNKCFYSKEIQSRLYIKIDTNFKPVLHLKIMILILRLLEGKKYKKLINYLLSVFYHVLFMIMV